MEYILDELKQFGLKLFLKNNLELNKNYIYTDNKEQYLIYFTNTNTNTMLKRNGIYFELDNNFNHLYMFDIFYNYCLNYSNSPYAIKQKGIGMKICKNKNSHYIIYINYVTFFYDNNNNVLILNTNFNKYYDNIIWFSNELNKFVYYTIFFKYQQILKLNEQFG